MSSRLTESAIEDFAIKLFERLGYSYIYAPDIAPDKVNGEAREGAPAHQSQVATCDVASGTQRGAAHQFTRTVGQ